ncbi:MAG TPA: N-acetylmuramic acid 6-phosphate etherase [Gemmatimonadota bacterium]|nr:N-acetylmuramic acid 6-phosphate etherase [Gemmatimonadota bacterium]
MTRDRSHLLTEKVNPRTADLDTLDTREILERIHAEDLRAFEAVGEILDDVERAATMVEEAFRSGGRLIYAGAGTSGRLGVLDAAECPPTFGSDPDMVVGVVAGGEKALVRSLEGAEDRADEGAAAVADLAVGPRDVVVGIAAGSTTPFAIGALREARRRGARAVLLACVPPRDIEVAGEVDLVIAPLTGPEVIAGSTRMKAGTATKLVLNMLTTTAMVRIGKTYGNLMVDLRIGSEKLADRGRRIVRDLLGVPEAEAERLLEAAGGSVKTALVMGRRKVDRVEAERLLDAAGGFLRQAWEGA